jgi:hypothetical protein
MKRAQNSKQQILRPKPQKHEETIRVMPDFFLTVENDGAEKLMSYLLAYRKMMSEKHSIPEEDKETVSIFIVEPMPERIKTSRKSGQNLRKTICL